MTNIATIDLDRHYNLARFPDHGDLWGDCNPPAGFALRPAEGYNDAFSVPYSGPRSLVAAGHPVPGRGMIGLDGPGVRPVPEMFPPAKKIK